MGHQGQLSEGVAALLHEFRALDTRKPQPLTDVAPPAFLRRGQPMGLPPDPESSTGPSTGHWGPEHHGGSTNLPRLRLGSRKDGTSSDGNGSHGAAVGGAAWESKAAASNWSPVQAARSQLAVDKPTILHRMDMVVDHCRIARDNRNYRLNSLGVFDGSKNEVRARSMLRVHMHKELSATSLRLPPNQKDIKLERPDDSLNSRLERMFVRVLRSIDEKPQAHRPMPLNVKGSPQQEGRRQRDHFSPGPHGVSPGAPRSNMDDLFGQRGLGAVPSLSTAFGDLDPDAAPPGLVHRQSLASRPASRANSGRYSQRPTSTRRNSSNLSSFSHLGPTTPKSPQGGGMASRNDWVANLPPELAAAQIAHLTAVTKLHIGRYHATVVEAQQEALSMSGMPEPVAGLRPDRLAAQLEEQLKKQEEETNLAAGGASAPQQGAGGEATSDMATLVHTTRSIPELISAVLKHCNDMSEDLQAFKASLPQKKESSKKERRMPSVPLPAMRQPGTSFQAGALQTFERPAAGAEQQFEHGSVQEGAAGGTGSGIWPSLIGQAGDDGMASGDDDERGTHEEGPSALQGPDVHAPGEPHRGSSSGAGPDGPPHGAPSPVPYVVNHSPITDKRLSTFQHRLQEAARSAESGQYGLPELPPLPAAPTASQHIQARLERVWDLLLVPLPARLDSVLAFTSRDRALEFEVALKVWESCAVGVPRREEMLSTLSSLQLGVSSNSLGYVSLPQVEEQCLELHRLTCSILHAASRLREVHGINLTYAGEPYPGPEAVLAEDMVKFLQWLRDSPTRLVP